MKAASKYRMLVIGSEAMSAHGLTDREPKDLDIISTKTEVAKFLRENGGEWQLKKKNEFVYNFVNSHGRSVEVFLATEGDSNSDYLNIAERDAITDGTFMYASPEILFSLKKSHINFPTGLARFNKHIADYATLHNLVFGNDIYSRITKKRFDETEVILGKLRTPKLNEESEKFFKRSEAVVKYIFDHDSLHQAMAHGERPMYTYMLKEEGKAMCDKQKWDAFTHLEKCQTVLEEGYVIALERKIIPGMFGDGDMLTTHEALQWSLMRICTNLCSGWFRQFAVDNYELIWRMRNPNYLALFLDAFAEGRVKTYRGLDG
jgi:hypothetical protein